MGEEGSAIHVVHIDDEPEFARLTARHLERESDRLSVESATTANEAFELLTDEIDCIVSDYRMPDQTGLEVFETVRMRFPSVPFILFTDTGSEEVASQAISLGVTDYLIKGTVAEQYSLLARKIIASVERRRAEQQATRTQQQLSELAEQTDDVLWIFSADWNDLQFVNSAYEDVFGQSVAQLTDEPQSFLAAVHPEDRDRVTAAMSLTSDGREAEVEYRVATPDTNEKWVTSHAKPIVEDGAVVRVVGFTRDITDRKHWEQRLQTKNDQLERFASVVAHDLRNPWSVADGYLDMAREKQDNDDLRRVASALDRMNQIITDVLTLARAGLAVDTPEPVSVNDVAAKSWDAVEHPEATLHIETQLTVLGDETRLQQAFENLFRNAIEHGGATVTITVGTLPDDTGFFIEDDGPGIPVSERDAVFEHGYTTTQTGTGFGLSIVKEIIDSHGWHLALTESATGGARFEISDIDR